MLQEIIQAYQSRFQTAPLLVKAPGRINLIGEHTDYNKGLVMPAAIDKAMYFALGQEGTSKELHIHAFNYQEKLIIGSEFLDGLPTWVKYFQAILQLLQEQGFSITGVHLVFGGDIPVGAGLSSSAALCCGFISGLSVLCNLQLTKKQIALLAQQAEQRIGLNCGLMDQYAVLFGKKDHVLQLDCNTLHFDYLPLNLQDYSLVLFDSKIEHQLANDTAYNERRASCERVAQLIATLSNHSEIDALSAISRELLLKFESEIDPIDFKRARYVLNENERVKQLAEAIGLQELAKFGKILLRGHWGLSKAYEVSLPEIDLLVQWAEESPAILGARMMGGGFGGCTLNLIEKQAKESTFDLMRRQYYEATKLELTMYELQIDKGLELVAFPK